MKQNRFLVLVMSAAITSSALFFSMTSAQAGSEKIIGSSNENVKSEDTSSSMGGSMLLGSLLVGCVYFLSRSQERESAAVVEKTTTYKD
ncbi:hypothetical protein QUB80_12195 [Chlorogloeopsis sp. ULAP01]|uniref:hypothetical protein n=1 Tax=Chlorogloeopsis sp. ULAP01 TaxID=3056483 RepID=UPI0025AB5D37|nr:hypothetical protein [Chlorogloeopsis sp. ULAP01]MDM9381462.1 hypothetical protein [Chlorogloeopsis sp. ULAP01]